MNKKLYVLKIYIKNKYFINDLIKLDHRGFILLDTFIILTGILISIHFTL
jgi:hypothetical protein